MRAYVSVKKKDITDGEPEDSTGCPVALAFNRLLKTGIRAEIGECITFLGTEKNPWNGDENIEIPIPVSVDTFAANFDDDDTRRDCEPFDFSLQLHHEVAAAILKPKYL